MKMTLKAARENPARGLGPEREEVDFTILAWDVMIEHPDLDAPLYVKRSELVKLLRLLEMP